MFNRGHPPDNDNDGGNDDDGDITNIYIPIWSHTYLTEIIYQLIEVMAQIL